MGMSIMKSLCVLLLISACISWTNAAISCWECDRRVSTTEDLDCFDPDSGYLGRVVQCKGNRYASEDMCLKKVGAPADLGITSDLAEVTVRGCIPADEDSPFGDDGKWDFKNHCKKDDNDVMICTCKDNHMCNAAIHRTAAGLIAILAAAAVAYVL